MKILYMHTIEGRPAMYDSRSKLILLYRRSFPIKLADSLLQIKREQRSARKASELVSRWLYSYQRVEVPSL